MARILSKNDFGLYQQIIFITTFLGSLIRFSFDEGIIFFFNFKKEKKYDYLLQSYNFLLIIGFIICLIAYLISSCFPNQLESEISAYSKHIIIYTFLLVTGGLVSKIFIIQKKSRTCSSAFFFIFFK